LGGHQRCCFLFFRRSTRCLAFCLPSLSRRCDLCPGSSVLLVFGVLRHSSGSPQQSLLGLICSL
jgi:hypothetical protein